MFRLYFMVAIAWPRVLPFRAFYGENFVKILVSCHRFKDRENKYVYLRLRSRKPFTVYVSDYTYLLMLLSPKTLFSLHVV